MARTATSVGSATHFHPANSSRCRLVPAVDFLVRREQMSESCAHVREGQRDFHIVTNKRDGLNGRIQDVTEHLNLGEW